MDTRAGKTIPDPSELGLSQQVAEALGAITDQAPVHWDQVEQTALSQAALESLRLVDDVARAYRGRAETGPTRATRPVLFQWGDLDVIERVGGGSYGEVFRAWDPWLERDVALKLFLRDASAGLDEARRLARLRHHNVLAVLGCAIDQGRAGLWSELIEGRTLADLVAKDGAFSSEETLRIGRDLAQALLVVHAAGLVHGDVKAENVMRERGGRIVLMDFGAGGDQRLMAGNRILSATLLYLPPEVLDGEPLSQRSDLYALCVLLHLLYRGTLPWKANDALALRAAHNERLRVLPVRADDVAEARLCALIERGLALDPQQRQRDAVELAAELRGELPAMPAVTLPVQSNRRLRLVAIAAAVIAAVTAIGYALTPAPWRSEAHFVRVGERGNETLDAQATVRVGDRLRLHFASNRSAYVYVLNEDANGTATLLYPLPGMGNPTVADAALDLPGGTGSTLAWQVGEGAEREEFLVFASTQPLPALEDSIQQWQRARGVQRSLDAVVDVAPPEISGPQLRQALRAVESSNGDVPVQRWHFEFSHAR